MVCGGTAFFEVKILSAVALAKEVIEYAGDLLSPFFDGFEDHDFKEIASFRVNGQKFTWRNKSASGAVGRPTPGLAAQFESFKEASWSKVSGFYQQRIRVYRESDSLAEATRRIFENGGDYGLLVIDGDNPKLKKNLVKGIKWRAKFVNSGEDQEIINLGYDAGQHRVQLTFLN